MGNYFVLKAVKEKNEGTVARRTRQPIKSALSGVHDRREKKKKRKEELRKHQVVERITSIS